MNRRSLRNEFINGLAWDAARRTIWESISRLSETQDEIGRSVWSWTASVEADSDELAGGEEKEIEYQLGGLATEGPVCCIRGEFCRDPKDWREVHEDCQPRSPFDKFFPFQPE